MTLPRRLFIAALFASLSLPQGCIEAPSSGGRSGGGGSSLRCLFVTDAFADSRSRQADFNAPEEKASSKKQGLNLFLLTEGGPKTAQATTTPAPYEES